MKKQSGFTLLEMIVVLVIIGLLAGLVGPNLFRQADRAKTQTAGTQVAMLRGSIHTYRLDVGRLPTEEEGLAVLLNKPANSEIGEFWEGPYVDGEVPNDPWNRPYIYQLRPSKTEEFSLFTYGADGRPGGEGFNADIGYLPAQ